MKTSTYFCFLIFVLLFSCQPTLKQNEQDYSFEYKLDPNNIPADSLYIYIEPFEEQVASTLNYLGIKPINKFTVCSKYRLVQNSFISILKVREQTAEGVKYLSTPELISSKFINYDRTAFFELPNNRGSIEKELNYTPTYLPLSIDKRMNEIRKNDSLYLYFGQKIVNPLDMEASLVSYKQLNKSTFLTARKNSIIHLFSAQIEIPDLVNNDLKTRISGDYILVLSVAVFDTNKEIDFKAMYKSAEFLKSAQQFSISSQSDKELKGILL